MDDAALEESTRHYYQQTSVALAKLAAKLTNNPFEKSIARVKLADLRSRMDKFAADLSATRYNGGLALLRRTYARAIESGHVATNEPAALKRVQPRKIARDDLPTSEYFSWIVADILDQKKGTAKPRRWWKNF